MALENFLHTINDVKFDPRTLQISFKENLTNELSEKANSFLSKSASLKSSSDIFKAIKGDWRKNKESIKHFFSLSKDVRTEILTFLTLYIHEYTHKVDFLITPFGLNYYLNTIHEYQCCQSFFPQLLDFPEDLDKITFLARFSDKIYNEEWMGEDMLKHYWNELKPYLYNFYSWGDVSNINPLKKDINEGWAGSNILDVNLLGKKLKKIIVLDKFHTFKPSDVNDKFWYLRPSTILETKSLCNSFLYILYLFKENGVKECLNYYEKVYLKKENIRLDYIFLLDIIARLYRFKDFHHLLKKGNFKKIKSSLFLLSNICWYSLHTPPLFENYTSIQTNPVLRLFNCIIFFIDYFNKNTSEFPQFKNFPQILKYIDNWEKSKNLQQVPLKDTIPACKRAIEFAYKLNKKHTWNPNIKNHFENILNLIYPYFKFRKITYHNEISISISGNPIMFHSESIVKNMILESKVSKEVSYWFNIRRNLFFFLKKLPKSTYENLNEHFKPFLATTVCECENFIHRWASDHMSEIDFYCPRCNKTKVVLKENFHRTELKNKFKKS